MINEDLSDHEGPCKDYCEVCGPCLDATLRERNMLRQRTSPATEPCSCPEFCTYHARAIFDSMRLQIGELERKVEGLENDLEVAENNEDLLEKRLRDMDCQRHIEITESNRPLGEERERIATLIDGFHDAWYFGRNGKLDPGQWADAIRKETEKRVVPVPNDEYPNKCNRHDDCRKAAADWRAKHPGKDFPVDFCCSDEGCEDCFGS